MQSACTVSRSIRAMQSFRHTLIHVLYGANRAGNRASTLHSYNSVTDKVKIHEQNNNDSTLLRTYVPTLNRFGRWYLKQWRSVVVRRRGGSRILQRGLLGSRKGGEGYAGPRSSQQEGMQSSPKGVWGEAPAALQLSHILSQKT